MGFLSSDNERSLRIGKVLTFCCFDGRNVSHFQVGMASYELLGQRSRDASQRGKAL